MIKILQVDIEKIAVVEQLDMAGGKVINSASETTYAKAIRNIETKSPMFEPNVNG